jgi:hypothetical protein
LSEEHLKNKIMKKSVFILAMLLMAATAFTQTSRRTANGQKPAKEEQAKSTEVKRQKTSKESSFVRKSNNSQSNKSTATSESSKTSQGVRRTTTGSTSGRSETPQEVRRSSTGSTTEKSNQAQGTIRRSNVNVTGNPSRNNTSTTRDNRRTQATQYHSQSHGSGNAGSGTTYVTTYQSPRLYHGTRVATYHYDRAPRSRVYRARHYPYRAPVNIGLYWTPAMRMEYVRLYPMVTTWRYPIGYRIPTVSAYDALFYQGEVMNVYGKVYEVFYSRETDEYMLYFGAYYPYHDLSVVVPGWIARRMSRWPEEYFQNQNVIVTGLVTTFEDRPEIAVRNTGQLRIY